jgi:hypothetical protein
MESPTANSWVRIGAPNDPPPFDNATTETAQDNLISANASKNADQDNKINALETRMDNAIVDHESGNGIRIQTNDNFWLEAQNRYGDYVVGGPTSKTDVPADIGYLWEKFFSESPVFAPTGMQSYSYSDMTNPPVISTDLETMKTLARKGRVKLFKGDTFNTQEGNIYDFGGYWNYNMGNSYEEKHMKQSGIVLNSSTLAEDETDVGGPNYSKIKHLENHGTNVWVTKVIKGASYDYSTGCDALEVKHKCNSYEYKYGGRSEEYKFTGEGIKVAHSWSEKCQSVEESFDPTTGSLLSYEFKDHKHFSYLAKIPTYPTLNISTCASAAAETSINISASATLAMNISASTGLKMDLGASMFLALKGHLGGDHTYNLNSKEWKSDLPFTQIYKNADFKASLEKAALRKVTADINKFDLVLESKELMIKHGKASISATNLAIFS